MYYEKSAYVHHLWIFSDVTMLLFLSSLFSLRPGCLRRLWLKSCKTKLLQRCFCFCSAVFRCLSFGYSKSNHPVYYCSPANLAKTLQKVNMKSRWCTHHVVPVSQARVNHFFFCESAKRGKPLQKFRKTFVAVNMKARSCTPHVVPVTQAQVIHFFFANPRSEGNRCRNFVRHLLLVNMKSRWCTPHVVPVSQARVNHFFFCESAKRGKPLQKFLRKFVAGEYESSAVYPSRCSGVSGSS